jgi:hypothetical protein
MPHSEAKKDPSSVSIECSEAPGRPTRPARHEAAARDSVPSLVVELASPPPALPKTGRVTEDRFLAGFVAALRHEGVDFVDTHADVHHAKFDVVMDVMRQRQADGDVGALQMPRTLMPTQMTGRYRELDDALLNMQRGHLSAPNPFYPGIRIKMSNARAERTLASFAPEQRQILLQLARTFREA